MTKNFTKVKTVLYDRDAALTWEKIAKLSSIKLYAGDVPDNPAYSGWIGLSITKSDSRHIFHDIRKSFPIPDNFIDLFQAEDVFEHIALSYIKDILNEIFRILKPGGNLRLSVPDYACNILINRSKKDSNGNIIYDPHDGGTENEPGHLWFPKYEILKSLLEQTNFTARGNINFLHFYDENGSPVLNPIDYKKGIVRRTPDFDERVKKPYRPMSLVVDLTKNLHEF